MAASCIQPLQCDLGAFSSGGVESASLFLEFALFWSLAGERNVAAMMGSSLEYNLRGSCHFPSMLESSHFQECHPAWLASQSTADPSADREDSKIELRLPVDSWKPLAAAYSR